MRSLFNCFKLLKDSILFRKKNFSILLKLNLNVFDLLIYLLRIIYILNNPHPKKYVYHNILYFFKI